MDSKHPWYVNGMIEREGPANGIGGIPGTQYSDFPQCRMTKFQSSLVKFHCCEVLESKGSRQAPGKNHRWLVIPWGWSIFLGAAVFFVSGHPESCLNILSLGEVFFSSFWPQKSWFSGGSLFILGSARGFMMGWDEQVEMISNSHQSSSGGDAKNRDFWQTQYTQSEASFRAWRMRQLT